MRSLKNLYHWAGAGVATLSLFMAGTAQADFNTSSAINPSGSSNFSNDFNFTNIFTNTASTVLNIVLLIAGVVAVFYLIWSGFQYITSAGNAEKVKAARAGIINAVIGIIIIIAAFFIVDVAIGIGNTATNN